MIMIIVLIGLFLFGGIGYFIYCDISLQKQIKAQKKDK